MKRETIQLWGVLMVCGLVAALLPRTGAAQVQIKPRILIVFDTSTSMLLDISSPEDEVYTNGDGSWDPWGPLSNGEPTRACCPGTGNSRMYAAKEAMRQMVTATGDIEFALMKYAQEYASDTADGWTDNDDEVPIIDYIKYRNNQNATGDDRMRYRSYWFNGVCYPSFVPYGDPLDYQWLAVEFPIPGDDNRDEILMWMDHHEFSTEPASLGNPDSSILSRHDDLEQELRATGATPLADSMIAAEQYLEAAFAADYALEPGNATCRPYSVVLLTDGDEFCGGNVTDAAEALHYLEDTQEKEVKIYVIGLNLSSTNLQDIAAIGGTDAAFSAESQDDLSQTLYTIIEDSILVEVCNQLDDDCDGETDEDFRFDQTYCNTWDGDTCGPDGTQENDEFLCARPSECACDGIDNNCDGVTDEPPDGQSSWGVDADSCGGCGEAIAGVCEYGGLSRCVRGDTVCNPGEGLVCVGGVGPLDEVCNGIDDDCDGDIDEDIATSDEICGPCGDGNWFCVNGQIQCCGSVTGNTCNPYTSPEPETCNTIDDDCDGETDEDISAVCGGCDSSVAGQDYCTDPNAGICQQGQQICVDGDLGPCEGSIGPQPETCNNQDDDCDGLTDEDLSSGEVCGTCEDGTWYCVNGAEVCCAGFDDNDACIPVHVPTFEVCNNFDDDCDGETDEAIPPRVCMDPETYLDRDGIGICHTGIQQCQAGEWGFGETAGTWELGACGYQQLPETEVCDCLDNDCDGETDESEDIPELGTACNACGTWQCVGCHLSCEGEGSTEICNGEDDNCNGLVDEIEPLPCGGCVEPMADPPAGEPEAVDPELLEDCLAAQAENPDIGPGEGECHEGARVCDPDAADPDFLWTACRGANPPTREVCDGKDNDCDAVTDEDEDIEQVGQQCATAIGECEDGWWQCVDDGEDGKSLECCKEVTDEGVCVPPQGPVVELCNGLDDDCDGDTDEDIPGEGAACGNDQGICEPGVYECTYDEVDGWDIRCVGNTAGTDEECNGLDDDCNGLVDDGLPVGDACTNDPGGAPPDGICDMGNYECFEGEWVCNGTVPGDEICDGLDNDCDGLTDEELVVECPAGSICIEGECAIPCVGEELSCPAQDMTCVSLEDEDGQVVRICVADVCNDDSENALPCVNNPYWCDEGYEPLCKCNAALKQCTSICDEVACPEGTVCVPITGNCRSLDDGCYAAGCPEGEVCRGGACIDDPCDGVTCADDEYCNGDGDCVGACFDMDCPVMCFEGACVDPCDGVSCDSTTEICNPMTGACEEMDACDGVTCKYYEVCLAGECEEDPCWSLSCPNGFVCENGTCHEFGAGASDGDVDGDADGDVDGDDDDDDGPLVGDDEPPENFGMNNVLATGAGGCLCATTPGATRSGNGLWMAVLGVMLLVWRLYRGPRRTVLALAMVGLLAFVLSACNTDPYHLTSGYQGPNGGSDDSSDIEDGDGQPEDSDGNDDSDDDDTSCKEDGEDNDCDGEDDDCDGETDEDIDHQTNTYHCGECNNNCNDRYEHALGVCEDGACRMGDCDVFFHDLEGKGEDCPYYCRQVSEQDRCNGIDFEDGSYMGVDDDCDGETDEDVLFDEDPLNCGRCGNRCLFPHAVPLCQAGECTYEECDENFYDIDEDPANGCEYSCEPTPDRDTPETELCNREDDDCDGVTDEGNPEGGAACYTPSEGCELVDGEYVCQGACRAGTERCVNGSIVCEGQVTPQPVETCDEDGLDENCNGVPDSDPAEGLFQLCQTETYEETGACRSGISSCVGGGWGPCENEVTPTEEQCDGIDNDCDGATDIIDGSPIVGDSCGGCDQRLYCAHGTMKCCLGLDDNGDCVVPGAETCNNVDDDCDGTTDELVESLCDGPDADLCNEGVTTCESGVLGCTDETGDSVEICDGLDNDCDGLTDTADDLETPPLDWCNEACGDRLLSPTCVGETGWRCNYNCVAEAAQDGTGVECDAQNQVVGSETWCNGYDDDCDGDTDENLTITADNCGACGNDCWALVPVGAHVASLACVNGACLINECDPGYWDLDGNEDGDLDCEYGECGLEIPVTSEGTACDGYDNDCDGLTDNGPGTTEVCNGADDDCDGSTDELTDLDPPNICNPLCPNFEDHVTICDSDSGSWRCDYRCVGETGGVVECVNGDGDGAIVDDETLCDGIDNDCDGTTDEGFQLWGSPAEPGSACANNGVGVCNGEGIVRCNSDTGAGEANKLVCCDAGETGAVCPAGSEIPQTITPDPAGEGTAPDGLDNDCDGYVDDGTTGCASVVQITGPSGTYNVFQYEASRAAVPVGNPASPVACSGSAAQPWTNVSFAKARNACLLLNADPDTSGCSYTNPDGNPDTCWDLCSTSQWYHACAYSSGWKDAYPYGNTYDAGTCNGAEFDATPVLENSGVADQCVAPWTNGDVLDLSGNAEEWTLGERGELRIIRGGSYKAVAQSLTCQYDIFAAAEADFQMDQLGFRCCQGAPPLSACQVAIDHVGNMAFDFEGAGAGRCSADGWVFSGEWEVGSFTDDNPTPTDGCLIGTNLDDAYAANTRNSASSPVMDLTTCAGATDGVELSFDMSFDTGANDTLRLLVSNDAGDTWYRMQTFTTDAAAWATYTQDVTAFANSNEFMIKFIFDSDGSGSGRGAYIDNINLERVTAPGTPDPGTLDTDTANDDNGESDACGTTLDVIYRDFSDSHVDFQAGYGNYRLCAGIVEDVLGANGKPVLNVDSACAVEFTSNDPADFDDWYTDDTHRFEDSLSLVDIGGGTFSYSDSSFFPLDGLGYGNEGRSHNYHFTTEIRTYFIYEEGQIFTFIGDDDVWVFIDGNLAVDVGGVHAEETQSVDLETLGLTPGYIYSLDVFHAERQTTESNFRIDTNLCFQNVD